MYMSMKDLLFLHFFMGVGICLFFAIRAFARQYKPPRSIFNYGDGIFGESKKWLQWYSWSIFFELVTSIMYAHTGLFYYEMAMSVFEAAAMTVGAFVVDRFFDMFMGAADITLPKPKIDLSAFKAKTDQIKENFKSHTPEVKDEVNEAVDTLKQEHEKAIETLNNLTKGH